MRKLIWCCGIMAAWAAGAWGQNASLAPQSGLNVPVAGTNAVTNGSVVAPVQSTPSRITLSGILSKFNIPGLYKTKPIMPVPPPGQTPSPLLYPSMAYGSSFKPAMPIPGKP